MQRIWKTIFDEQQKEIGGLQEQFTMHQELDDQSIGNLEPELVGLETQLEEQKASAEAMQVAHKERVNTTNTQTS